jgi:hypothetical protein
VSMTIHIFINFGGSQDVKRDEETNNTRNNDDNSLIGGEVGFFKTNRDIYIIFLKK